MKIVVVFCLLFEQLLGQNGAIDSTAKSISNKLINHGYYEMWFGQPWENSNGIEVPGYTDLDRRIRFFKDSLFEEVVFKDGFFEVVFPIDDCEKTMTNYKKQGKYTTEYLTGKWNMVKDTIYVQYKTKYLYAESPFLDCFYISQRTGFKCDTPPICTSQYNIIRYFVLNNEQLCFVKPDGGCYK